MQWEIPNLRQGESQHGGDRHAQTETQLRCVGAGLGAAEIQSDTGYSFETSVASFPRDPPSAAIRSNFR
jgi:hypothetical protein